MWSVDVDNSYCANSDPVCSARSRDSSNPPRSQVLAAVNFNMFAIFMVANLATGAVNISMRTLDADPWAAVTILLIYVTFVAGVAVILASRGIAIKV